MSDLALSCLNVQFSQVPNTKISQLFQRVCRNIIDVTGSNKTRRMRKASHTEDQQHVLYYKAITPAGDRAFASPGLH